MTVHIETIVTRYFELLKSNDVDALLELWGDNGLFDIPLLGKLKGKEEIRKFYQSLPAASAKHHNHPIGLVVSGNQAVVKVSKTNTTPDGKTITFEAFSWMVFDDEGKLLSIEAKIDSARLLKDLKD